MRSRHRLQVGRPDAAVVQHKSNGERAALVLVPSISRLEVRTHSCFLIRLARCLGTACVTPATTRLSLTVRKRRCQPADFEEGWSCSAPGSELWACRAFAAGSHCSCRDRTT